MKKEAAHKSEPVLDVNRITRDLRDLGQNAWLVGLGAVATVEEKGSGIINDLLEKGKDFDKRDKTVVEKSLGEAAEQLRAFGNKVEGGVKDGTRAMLNRFGIPTHEQIQQLIDRVDKLNTKVEKLSA